MRIRASLGASCVLLLVWACATTNKEEPKIEASSEVIYEEAPNTDVPANPWRGCQGQQQQLATVIRCGNIVVVYVDVAQGLSAEALDAELESFQKSFPPQSTRERFTQEIAGRQVTGMRVFEESEAAPFRAEMIVLPESETRTRVLSCAVSGTTDYTRCGKVVADLVESGLPSDVPGLPAPQPMDQADGGMADLDGGEAPAGEEPSSDAGMPADAGV